MTLPTSYFLNILIKLFIESQKNIQFEGCLTVHLPRETMWNASLMQQRNSIDVFLVLHVSGTYAHHQEH